MLSPTASSLFGPVLPLFSHPALVFDADLTSSDVASDFFSILYSSNFLPAEKEVFEFLVRFFVGTKTYQN